MTDLRGMETKAVDDADLMGFPRKQMITNGTIADLAIVWSKLDGIIRDS